MMLAGGAHEAPRGRTRQDRRYGKTRRKLLNAAKAVMAEKGLAATTVDEIAQRADVGRGSFYYHFDAKDELIRHMMEKVLEELTEKMVERCAVQQDVDSVLDAMIRAHIEFFSNRWEDFVFYYQGSADLMLDESYDGIETPFLRYIGHIEDLIERVIAQPVSKNRLRRLACAIAGFISGYYSFASVASQDDDVDASFASLRSAFVASLARFIQEALPDGGRADMG
jgi:AcrR family transcriptional regulator